MKKLSLFLVITFLFFGLCFSQYQLEDGYIETISDQNAKSSFTFKNLRIYPLTAGNNFKNAHKDIGKYSTLKESIEQNKIKITETDSEINTDAINNRTNNNINNSIRHRNDLTDAPNPNNNDQIQIQLNNNEIQQNTNYSPGAQVNTLYIENISKDTVYIMAGEVVKGGKQDRVLAQDMILPPRSGKVDISVFCVERNRWSYNDTKSFNQYFSVSSNSIRKTVIQEQDQSAVWEEVGKTVKKNHTETNSGTYTSLVNSKEYNKQVKEYSDYLLKALKATPNCIGFVGVSGNEIIGCDIFATPDLFSKQSETILKGYITEAVINGKEVNIDYSEVQKYLNELLTDQEEDQDKVINEKGGQYKFNNKKIHITTF